MSTSRRLSATLDLLWSLWTELGVPGGDRSHDQIAIEPEPLIAVTPHLARSDARLLELAFDWCAAHFEQVSKARITGIAKGLSLPAQDQLARFNGALAHHSIEWKPCHEDALPLQRNREQIALPVSRPALLVFRLRALVGNSSRADVLTRLLFAPPNGLDAASLTPWGTSRRSVERVLGDLVTASLVATTGTERRRQFRLSEPQALATVVSAKNLQWWNWDLVFSFLTKLDELETASESLDASVAGVKFAAQFPWLTDWATQFGSKPPAPFRGANEANSIISAWAASLTEELAAGKAPPQTPMPTTGGAQSR